MQAQSTKHTKNLFHDYEPEFYKITPDLIINNQKLSQMNITIPGVPLTISLLSGMFTGKDNIQKPSAGQKERRPE
jgi:hypothetical protein